MWHKSVIYPLNQNIADRIQKCHMGICHGQRTRRCKEITPSLSQVGPLLDHSAEVLKSGSACWQSHTAKHFALLKNETVKIQKTVHFVPWLQQRTPQGNLIGFTVCGGPETWLEILLAWEQMNGGCFGRCRFLVKEWWNPNVFPWKEQACASVIESGVPCSVQRAGSGFLWFSLQQHALIQVGGR